MTMKLLVIGGTKFLGRAVVEAALAAGHDVTLFNRGRTNPGLFPDVENLRGDRDTDLSALRNRRWDAVVDPSGYVPRVVRQAAELLADFVEHYTFISSISVYPFPVRPGTDESALVETLDDPTIEDITGETYGGLKALCEQAAEAAMPGRVLNVRAGLIVGPHDPTDRFTYWPVRIARSADVLCPPLESPIQVIDVRDLAEWILRMIDRRAGGVYNATGPDDAMTFGDLLAACRDVTGSGAALVEASETFLIEQEVAPWADLPLWLPGEQAGMSRVSIRKAKANGLTFRPIETTIRDTLTWYEAERGQDAPLKFGISGEREAEVLLTLKQTHN
jgi:2'-hydroxyisoflavone reductase